MASSVSPPLDPKKTKTRRVVRFSWRALLRALHRDVGYLAVGLTFVYALSGLAVNHVADWDPNFQNTSRTVEMGAPIPGDDGEVSRVVLGKMGITEVPREAYRVGPDAVDILFDRRTLHVNTATGRIEEEGQKPRFLIRASNWLHLNRGKKAWTWVADSYAAGLLFLATSGMFMIAGRKGLLGRGAILVALGAAIPIAYVALSGGP